jgi:hypothetical protein
MHILPLGQPQIWKDTRMASDSEAPHNRHMESCHGRVERNHGGSSHPPPYFPDDAVQGQRVRSQGCTEEGLEISLLISGDLIRLSLAAVKKIKDGS